MRKDAPMKTKKWNVLIFLVVLALVILVLSITMGGDPGPEPEPEPDPSVTEYLEYTFRNARLLTEHFEKHGVYMGFSTEEEYEKAASDVANDPEALHKLEKEDGDDVYYKEETNEFVVISKDGFIRTYFCPDSGKKYFDKQ